MTTLNPMNLSNRFDELDCCFVIRQSISEYLHLPYFIHIDSCSYEFGYIPKGWLDMCCGYELDTWLFALTGCLDSELT